MAVDQSARKRARRRAEEQQRPESLPLNPLEHLPLRLERVDRDSPRLRRWDIGGLTFFNMKPKASHMPIVESVPLVAETIASAFVSGFTNPTLPPQTYSGAVYRNDGKIVPEFMEWDELTQHRVPRRVNVPVVERTRVEQAPRVDDACVYLGPLSVHFGHFLLESLPRVWYLKDADPAASLLFHGHDERVDLPSFAIAAFGALGVDPARIRIVNRDIQAARLILPTSQYWQGIKASPGMCIIFDRMRERILNSRANAARTPAKIYFTRRHLGAERGSGQPRVSIANEGEAELFFRKRGYEILAPEMLPLEEQVAIVANATHIAGPSGSALHLVLFNDNPRTRLIELRTKPAINQLLIGAIRGTEAFHIWSRAKESPPNRIVLLMDVIEQAMREID